MQDQLSAEQSNKNQLTSNYIRSIVQGKDFTMLVQNMRRQEELESQQHEELQPTMQYNGPLNAATRDQFKKTSTISVNLEELQGGRFSKGKSTLPSSKKTPFSYIRNADLKKMSVGPELQRCVNQLQLNAPLAQYEKRISHCQMPTQPRGQPSLEPAQDKHFLSVVPLDGYQKSYDNSPAHIEEDLYMSKTPRSTLVPADAGPSKRKPSIQPNLVQTQLDKIDEPARHRASRTTSIVQQLFANQAGNQGGHQGGHPGQPQDDPVQSDSDIESSVQTDQQAGHSQLNVESTMNKLLREGQITSNDKISSVLNLHLQHTQYLIEPSAQQDQWTEIEEEQTPLNSEKMAQGIRGKSHTSTLHMPIQSLGPMQQSEGLYSSKTPKEVIKHSLFKTESQSCQIKRSLIRRGIRMHTEFYRDYLLDGADESSLPPETDSDALNPFQWGALLPFKSLVKLERQFLCAQVYLSFLEEGEPCTSSKWVIELPCMARLQVQIRCQLLSSRAAWSGDLSCQFMQFVKKCLGKRSYRKFWLLSSLNFRKGDRARIAQRLQQLIICEDNQLRLYDEKRGTGAPATHAAAHATAEETEVDVRSHPDYRLALIISQDRAAYGRQLARYREEHQPRAVSKLKGFIVVPDNLRKLSSPNLRAARSCAHESLEEVDMEQVHYLRWKQHYFDMASLYRLNLNKMQLYQEIEYSIQHCAYHLFAQSCILTPKPMMLKVDLHESWSRVLAYAPAARNPYLYLTNRRGQDDKIRKTLLFKETSEKSVLRGHIRYEMMGKNLLYRTTWVGKKLLPSKQPPDANPNGLPPDKYQVRLAQQQLQYEQLCSFFSATTSRYELSNSSKTLFNKIQEVKFMLMTVNFDCVAETQHEFLANNFERKEHFVLDKIMPSRDKVQLRANVYRTRTFSTLTQLVFLRYDVAVIRRSKTKLSKIILDLSDVQNLFDSQFSYENCFDRIIKVSSALCKSLAYHRRFLYKNF